MTDYKINTTRLKNRRKELKITQDEIAKSIGITRSAYANYELGYTQPPMDKAKKIADSLNTHIDYLYDMSKFKNDEEELAYQKECEMRFNATPKKIIGYLDEENKRLPIYKTIQDQNINFITSTQTRKINVLGSIPAGTPIEAIEDVIDTIDIPTSWRGDYIALKVQGDSMYPEYLDGDIIIIQVQPDCDSGDDCACYVNGYDATFKRVYKNNGSITLQPLNPKYPPKTYTHPGEVSILGKVIELRRSK